MIDWMLKDWFYLQGYITKDDNVQILAHNVV